jgi:hypothetical protein
MGLPRIQFPATFARVILAISEVLPGRRSG